MPFYEKPGVYYERLDATAPRIVSIRTDIAGFVGIARRGPIDTPIPVESFRQFESHFGGFTGAGYLAFCVRAFFENQGRRCWIVRVAGGHEGTDARTARYDIPTTAGGPGLAITASSGGLWGESLSVEWREVRAAQTILPAFVGGAASSEVLSVSGFERRSLVRLRQSVPPAPGPLEEYRILSGVDQFNRRLMWRHDDPDLRLDTDAPLTGFDTTYPIQVEALEYELLVRLDGRLVESHRALTLVRDHERHVATVLRTVYDAPEQEARRRTSRAPRLIEVSDERDDPLAPVSLPSEAISLAGGFDGLSTLTPYDYIGAEVSPHDSDKVKRAKRRGIRVLELVDEIAILAVPDIHIQPLPAPQTVEPEVCLPDPCLPTTLVTGARPRTPTSGERPPVFNEAQLYEVQEAMVAHCETRRDRLAILDPPAFTAEHTGAGVMSVREWRSRFETKYAAMYWPWVRTTSPFHKAEELTRRIPPSGHVAGLFAKTDFDVGVHKAPANAALQWIQDVTVPVDDAQHGLLNTLGLNAIRPVAARGIRILGARTLSSDPDARYVNVRRLVMMVMKAIDLCTQWAVFEPNNAVTRAKVTVSLISFLTALWQNGALMGDHPEAAFFVRCDESNNPAPSRDLGRLVADVGIAASVPFEFVVVRVGRTENALEIDETVAKRGAA